VETTVAQVVTIAEVATTTAEAVVVLVAVQTVVVDLKEKNK
jgi:hypothetical protein